MVIELSQLQVIYLLEVIEQQIHSTPPGQERDMAEGIRQALARRI